MALEDIETYLPTGPYHVVAKWAIHAYQYNASYNAAHVRLVSEGWLFADLLGTRFGSDDGLHFLGGLLASEGHNLWDEWPGAEQWFMPYQEWMGQSEVTAIVNMASEWPFPVAADITHRHIHMVNESVWQTSPHNIWSLGVFRRWALRMAQHRIAKCLENLLCLDERGRPLEE